MRNRILLAVVLFIPVILTAQYKKEVAKVKPVILTVDSAIFKPNAYWIDPPARLELFYDGLSGLEIDMAYLRQGSSTELLIQEPCFIQINGVNSQLIYPGEHVEIKFNSDQSAILFYSPGNKERSMDFNITTTFYDSGSTLSRKSYYTFHNTPVNSVDDLLQLESRIVAAKKEISMRKHAILDSLLKLYRSGNEIAETLNNKISADSLSSIFSFIEDYRADLVKYGLLNERLLQLTHGFDKWSDSRGLDIYFKHTLSSIFDFVLRTRDIRTIIRDEKGYKNFKNVIDSFFDGNARAYLWSQAVFDCIKRHIPLSAETLIAYKEDKANAVYKDIIEKRILESEKLDAIIAKPGISRLASMTTKQSVLMESLLRKYKGKLVLIDFWASWCAPCREELPSSLALHNELSGKVQFLYVSLDGSYSNWIKATTSEKIDPKNSYLLVDGKKADVYTKYQLGTIPRYLLFGKDGTIIDADAPRPSDKKLRELIEQHL